jgi:hypothetical protein
MENNPNACGPIGPPRPYPVTTYCLQIDLLFSHTNKTAHLNRFAQNITVQMTHYRDFAQYSLTDGMGRDSVILFPGGAH